MLVHGDSLVCRRAGAGAGLTTRPDHRATWAPSRHGSSRVSRPEDKAGGVQSCWRPSPRHHPLALLLYPAGPQRAILCARWRETKWTPEVRIAAAGLARGAARRLPACLPEFRGASYPTLGRQSLIRGPGGSAGRLAGIPPPVSQGFLEITCQPGDSLLFFWW